MRIISGLVLAVLAYLGIWHLSSDIFSYIILGICAAAALEFAQLVTPNKTERYACLLLTLLCANLMLDGMLSAVLAALVFSLFVLGLVVMRQSQQIEKATAQYGVLMLGLCYVGLTLPMWAWLHRLPSGRAWVLLGIAAAALCDTFAWFVGKNWGKKKFSPIISPKKTWAGYWGSLLGSFCGATLVWYLALQTQVAFVHVFASAGIIWITGPFGDLIESMLKRSAGVKDSGHIIPGHGGILDRMDALIFTGPALYWYVTTFVQ